MTPGQYVWTREAAPPGDRTAPGTNSAAAAMLAATALATMICQACIDAPIPEETDPIAATARCMLLQSAVRKICLLRSAPGKFRASNADLVETLYQSAPSPTDPAPCRSASGAATERKSLRQRIFPSPAP